MELELSYFESALRLCLAVLLGGLIGFEREVHNRPAGFRTHILVCVGSALIMMVSAYGFLTGDFKGMDIEVDPGRIAAQVITGIGFLGAGTIIQHRGNIQGLTTAAGIWVVSGIGLAVGIGYYVAAIFSTLIVIISLFVLNKVDNVYLSGKRFKSLSIKAIDQPGLLGKVSGALGEFNINVRKINLSQFDYTETYKSEVVSIEFIVKIPAQLKSHDLFRRLAEIDGVLEIYWQGENIFVSSSSATSSFFS